MSGVWHPDGCRCSGCRQPAAWTPARQPARYYPPRPAGSGDFVTRNGVIGPGILIGFIVLLVGFWPALAWHGHTAAGGWRWDIHSTIGCLIWWGVTLGPLAAVVIADARKKRAAAGGGS